MERFVSWNVNGIRAILKKGFLDIFDVAAADVFAIQETKCQAGQVELDLPGYHQSWSYAERKGYSGTAVFSRERPLQVVRTIGDEAADTEGRICAVELERHWFVNAYVPNSQNELARIDVRHGFDLALARFLEDLARDKPVVFCGDCNVAHQPIDLRHPQAHEGDAGFSAVERDDFTDLLDRGFVDTFRYLHPDATDVYTWWSYLRGARRTNAGWRIDYFLVSADLAPSIARADCLGEVMGSDHCPVMLELA